MLKVEIPETAWRLYMSRPYRFSHWLLVLPALSLLLTTLPTIGFLGGVFFGAFAYVLMFLILRRIACLAETFSKSPPRVVLEVTDERLSINLEEKTEVDLASIDKLSWSWADFFFLNLLIITIHQTDGSFRVVRSQAASPTIRRAIDVANQRIAS